MHKRKPVRAITLRNLPPEVAHRVSQIAKAKSISLNKAVLGLLEERLGVAKEPRHVHHDLDQFAGIWNAREAAEFEDALASQRTIDDKLWR